MRSQKKTLESMQMNWMAKHGCDIRFPYGMMLGKQERRPN